MRTFSIQTLGCKVNQYEGDQIAQVLRAHGLVETKDGPVDIRVINTCSVTSAAAKDSRSLTRRSVNLAGKTIVTGCWATSDAKVAEQLGADVVLTHHDDVAKKLSELLNHWNVSQKTFRHSDNTTAAVEGFHPARATGAVSASSMVATELDLFSLPLRERVGDRGAASDSSATIYDKHLPFTPAVSRRGRGGQTHTGTHSLPLLNQRQSSHQRAFLKIQDGCDAHCTYCIIPQLRPGLWSKPVHDVVREARQLVDAGHQELILTGIFLGAYGESTALRRRQEGPTGSGIGELIDALCTQVPNLRRVRLSSLEPGDLTSELIATLKSHPQIVPHFHLPLQSGSDLLLKRMNRQYTRDDFIQMIDRVNEAFDRPALTTDIIVGFPGETADEFARTLEIVDRAKFIHIHAFSFSARPGTAAARWTKDFVRGPVVNERIAILNALARAFSERYRTQFIGETVEVLVEQFEDPATVVRHGRCERYFDVYFEGSHPAGESVKVRIDRVTPTRTFGVQVRRSLPVLAATP